MRFNYNVTGKKRKSLVDAVSLELNTSTKYFGAPTFTYEVGDYLIDKNGVLEGPDNLDLEAALHQKGFHAVERKYAEPDRLVIEMPLDGFTDEALTKLEKLVSSKASLIKKAIGAENLPIERTENTLKFPWFTLNPDSGAEEVSAYTHFVTALCKLAKTQQRVNATENSVDNEKYAFRCFLLRLGFVGKAYKAERKILLSKLTGNSAFKNPIQGGADDE